MEPLQGDVRQDDFRLIHLIVFRIEILCENLRNLFDNQLFIVETYMIQIVFLTVGNMPEIKGI